MFRLNRKEAEALDKKVKKSGLSREAYLRHHMFHAMDVQKYDTNMRLLEDAIKRITEAVILPERRE